MSARYTPQIAESLLKGAVESVLKLEDFPLYDYLKEKGITIGIEKGRENGLRDTVLRVGEKRYGAATETVRETLAASNFETLQDYVERLAEAETWDELLTP